MKILVLGGNGMLGHKLIQVLSKNYDVYTTLRNKNNVFSSFNIIDEKRIIQYDVNLNSISEIIEKVFPKVVINCIGIIKQLKEANNHEKCISINSLFPHVLNNVCKDVGSMLIHISTDCVFSGKKGEYEEDDIPDPIDLYGRSKLLGEIKDFPGITLRTSIIGRELFSSNGLVEWFLSNNNNNIKGFSKATYSGFTTSEFAKIIKKVIDAKLEHGLYQISSDPITKLELLRLIKHYFMLNITIEKDDSFICNRSLNSSKLRKILNYIPPSWDEMIREMKEDSLSYEEWRKK